MKLRRPTLANDRAGKTVEWVGEDGKRRDGDKDADGERQVRERDIKRQILR